MVEYKDDINDTSEIEQDLLRTEWVEEAKQIPLTELNTEEQLILIKCINKAEFEPDEISQLKTLLNRYRKAIREQKPIEVIENAEKNIEHIKNIKEYINILKTSKESRTYTIMYPINETEEIPIPLVINKDLTAEATRLITSLQSIGAFVDYDEHDRNIYARYNNGEQLTPEEQQIARQVEQRLQEIGFENYQQIKDTATQFLALQTRIKDVESSYEEMLEFYGEMKLNILTALFEKVQKIVGVNDINREKIFRKFS